MCLCVCVCVCLCAGVMVNSIYMCVVSIKIKNSLEHGLLKWGHVEVSSGILEYRVHVSKCLDSFLPPSIPLM